MPNSHIQRLTWIEDICTNTLLFTQTSNDYLFKISKRKPFCLPQKLILSFTSAYQIAQNQLQRLSYSQKPIFQQLKFMRFVISSKGILFWILTIMRFVLFFEIASFCVLISIFQLDPSTKNDATCLEESLLHQRGSCRFHKTIPCKGTKR